MISPDLQEKAVGVISRVLEDAAFVFTDQLDVQDIPDAVSWDADGVSLTFEGYRRGELHMWASDGFARIAAANMLGIDVSEEGAREKGMDALKEILNMIVGNLLSAMFGDEPVFDLAIPQKLSESVLAGDCKSSDGIWLAAEEHAVLFTIVLA